MIHVGVLSPVTGGFYFGEVLAGVVQEVAAVGGLVTLVQTLDAGRTGDELAPAPTITTPVGLDRFDGVVAIAQASDAAYLRTLGTDGSRSSGTSPSPTCANATTATSPGWPSTASSLMASRSPPTTTSRPAGWAWRRRSRQPDRSSPRRSPRPTGSPSGSWPA